MRERFRRVKRIFERAVELEGEALEACLREACGDDRGLLDQLRGMLEADVFAPLQPAAQ